MQVVTAANLVSPNVSSEVASGLVTGSVGQYNLAVPSNASFLLIRLVRSLAESVDHMQ